MFHDDYVITTTNQLPAVTIINLGLLPIPQDAKVRFGGTRGKERQEGMTPETGLASSEWHSLRRRFRIRGCSFSLYYLTFLVDSAGIALLRR